MMASPTRQLVVQGLLAAIYATLTVVLEPISYGIIQFRLAEVLLVLVLLHRPSWIGLTLGCFIANTFSPLGLVDMVFGTLATAITCGGMLLLATRPALALLLPAVVNALVIGLLLYFVFDLPLLLAMASVGAGEWVVTYLPGLLLYYKLKDNQLLGRLLRGSAPQEPAA